MASYKILADVIIDRHNKMRTKDSVVDGEVFGEAATKDLLAAKLIAVVKKADEVQNNNTPTADEAK